MSRRLLINEDPVPPQPANPFLEAGWLSRLLFSWVTPLIKYGRKHKLTSGDLGQVIPSMSTKAQCNVFEENWIRYRDTSKYSIFRALIKTYWKEFSVAMFLNFTQMFIQVAIPVNIGLLVNYMENPEGEDGGLAFGITIIFSYIIINFLNKIIEEQASFRQNLIGVKSYAAMVSIIYKKWLRVSTATNKEFTKGEIVNFIQVDAARLGEVAFLFPGIAKLPLELILAIAYLLYYYGVYVLVPLGIVCWASIGIFIASWINAKIEAKMLSAKDGRMKNITEAINSIKIVKLMAWKKIFIEKISKYRNQEITYTKLIFLMNSIEIFLIFILVPMLRTIMFLVFMVTGHPIDIAHAFVTITVLYALYEPIQWFPQFLGVFIEFMISMKRIQKFLLWDEVNRQLVIQDDRTLQEQGIDVFMNKSTFTWAGKLNLANEKENDDSDEEVKKHIKAPKQPKSKAKSNKINSSINFNQNEEESASLNQSLLKSDQTFAEEGEEEDEEEKEVQLHDNLQVSDISLSIEKGEFICIIGEVGSGKSSLLSAILGDMIYLDEDMIAEFQDQLITPEFRHKLNEMSIKHKGVIKMGGSVSYVQQIPWIQNKTIRENILFGQPMDEDRYNHVINICQLANDLEILPGGDLTEIGEKGINLSGGQKARISLARAVYAQREIVLMDDPISALDSNVKKQIFDKVLLEELNGKTRILVTHAVDFLEKVDRIVIMEKGSIKHIGTYEELQHSDEIKHIIETLSHVHKTVKEENKHELKNEFDDADEDDQSIRQTFLSDSATRITEDENEENIDVPWSIYFKFFFEQKTWMFYLLVFPIFILYLYLSIYDTIYNALWIKSFDNKEEFWRYFYFVLFYPIGFAMCITVIFALIAFSTLRIAKALHNEMTIKIFNAPINLFFDKNPSGKLLNRFSGDISKVDDEICHNLTWCAEWYIVASSNIYLAAINSPWVLIIVPVVIAICVILLKYYTRVYRELTRLNSVLHTPLLNHLGETLTGATTIRTFQKQSDFIEQNYAISDSLIVADFWKDAVSRWFAIRIEILSIVIILFVSVFLIMFKSEANSILIGTLFLHFTQLSTDILWASQDLTKVESNFVGYNRWVSILNIPQERSSHEELAKSWPSQGTVQFKSYFLRYRPETELVLKDVSIFIRDKEKIGVVGRTGAGKSTLWLALWRIVEADSGEIIIDDVDISKMSLEQLRDKITIIPQDPTLFNGTLRFNLDPQNKYSDEELLELASQAALDKLIERDDKGLNQEIEEHGQNLSSGEKQLLCICRAILKKNKIVLMDEATANIDIKTEQIIQKLIKEKFEEATVITIAHRLNTIIHSDKVLVLEKGEAIEFDSPQKLLENPNSMFYALVQTANKHN